MTAPRTLFDEPTVEITVRLARTLLTAAYQAAAAAEVEVIRLTNDPAASTDARATAHSEWSQLRSAAETLAPLVREGEMERLRRREAGLARYGRGRAA